jgi:uncharacterized protein with NRDE domain
MCTLIVLNEYLDGYPLIVAANRDERYDRESSPPEVITNGDKSLIRPWDHEKDGTWIGIAQDGWFVGLTNQDNHDHDDCLLSRGKVVDVCLEAGNHVLVARYLTQLDPTCYNPFNIVFGRPGAMFLTRVCPGHGLEMEPLPTGISVISNDCCGKRYQRKVNHAHALACNIGPNDGELSVSSELFRLLSDHTHATVDDPFQALCVHADDRGFGTRSTSIVTVSNDGNVEYWYSEGPPCRSDGLTLTGRLLRLGFDDLEPTVLTDEDIEEIG